MRTTRLAVAALATIAVLLSLPDDVQARSASPARSAATVTSANLLANPSFEKQTAPWIGTNLSRKRRPHAPQGKWVARVASLGGRVVIDDWPGEVTDSVPGSVYTASVQLATATGASWNRPVTLVVREHDQSGTWVGSQEVTTTLRWYFQTLTVSLTAVRAGDVIDVYASQRDVTDGSAFFADDADLVATSSAPSGPAPSTLGLLAYASGQASALGDTSRYAYVVIQENQYAHIAAIKAANPDTKVLAYMNTSADRRTDCSTSRDDPHLRGASFGINYCWVDRYHPDWFLTDRSGIRLHFADYPFAMQVDPGNADFATAWAASVYDNAEQDGFDGIWIDDLNIDPGHGLNGRIAKYTDEQFGAASTAWGAEVGDYLRSRGMTVIANLGMAPWVGYQLADALSVGQHLTAVNREHWSRYGDICGPFGERFNNTATNGTPPISTMLDYAEQLQAQGTAVTGVDYGYTDPTSDDVQAMTYGRAMFLLTWDGTAGSAYFYRRCGANDTSFPQWTADLGLPTGPVVQDADGVLSRPYESGEVVLNPNRAAGAQVAVDRALHTASGTSTDGTIYVAPQTALILQG